MCHHSLDWFLSSESCKSKNHYAEASASLQTHWRGLPFSLAQTEGIHLIEEDVHRDVLSLISLPEAETRVFAPLHSVYLDFKKRETESNSSDEEILLRVCEDLLGLDPQAEYKVIVLLGSGYASDLVQVVLDAVKVCYPQAVIVGGLTGSKTLLVYEEGEM